MTDILIGLPCVSIVALLIGAGWGMVFRRVTPWGLHGFLFRSWVCAIATTSLVWAWAYPLNFDVRWGLALELALSATGYVIAFATRAPREQSLAVSARTLLSLLIPFALAVIALLPAMASLNRLSVADRIGPDAFGYAISASAVEDGLTHTEIVHAVLRESGSRSIGQAISPVTKRIDTTPSFTTQVQGEFLEGADRWGLAGTAGMVLYLIGAQHLWSMLSLLAGFALMTTCTGIWAAIRGRGKSARHAVLAVILVALSCSLLDAWHEGGLGQIWVMPAALMIALSVLHFGEHERLGAAIAVGIGVVVILPSYNQDIITVGILMGVVVVLSLVIWSRGLLSAWIRVACGAVVGAALVVPASVAFGMSFGTSLHENASAGWVQNYWFSVGQAFGLSNGFSSTLQTLVPRTLDERLLDGGGSLLVALLLLLLVYGAERGPGLILFLSTVSVCAGVYVGTRYLAPSSNYQYFKVLATLTPIGALSVGLLMGERRSIRTSGHSALGAWLLRNKISKKVIATTAVLVCLAVAASASVYIYDFRAEGSTVPAALEGLASSSRAHAVFERYNIVGPSLGPPVYPNRVLYDSYALAAEENLRFIGRTFGVTPTRIGGRVLNPVAMVVFEDQCPRFVCLAKVPNRAIVLREDAIVVVRLSPTTKELERIPETEWTLWAATKFLALGGFFQGYGRAGLRNSVTMNPRAPHGHRR